MRSRVGGGEWGGGGQGERETIARREMNGWQTECAEGEKRESDGQMERGEEEVTLMK